MSYNGGAAALKEWCERRAEHKEHQARQTAGRNWPESEILADDAAKLREIAALLPRTCDRCGKELGKDADAYCQGHGEPPDAPRAHRDADAGRRVTVYSEGPLTLSVCAPREMGITDVLADAERQHPCGTMNGWQQSSDEWMRWDAEKQEKVKTGRTGPIPCEQDAGRTHWLLTA